MTTLAALRRTTLNILFGLDDFEYPKSDRLDGSINDTIETVAFDTSGLWDVDDYAEFQANGEVIQFLDSAATLAKRGQRGTTAASQSDDADVLKNPPFYQHQVDEQINAVVRSELWPKVWTWHRDSLTPSSIDHMYDLDQYVEEVVMVYQENIDTDEVFRPLHPGWWDVERQISTSVATNSNLLILKKVYDYDATVYYTAKRRPHVDDLANVSDEIADLIPYAAAARCIAFRSPQIKQAAHRASRQQESTLLQDYRALLTEFIRQRDSLHRLLMEEVRPDMRHRPVTRVFRRSW